MPGHKKKGSRKKRNWRTKTPWQAIAYFSCRCKAPVFVHTYVCFDSASLRQKLAVVGILSCVFFLFADQVEGRQWRESKASRHKMSFIYQFVVETIHKKLYDILQMMCFVRWLSMHVRFTWNLCTHKRRHIAHNFLSCELLSQCSVTFIYILLAIKILLQMMVTQIVE